MAEKPNDPPDVETMQRQIAELQAAQAALQAQLAAAQQAHVDGYGAAAQGGGDALEAHSVQVQGDNAAPINTGTAISAAGGAVIEGALEVRNGHVIGRDFIQTITLPVSIAVIMAGRSEAAPRSGYWLSRPHAPHGGASRRAAPRSRYGLLQTAASPRAALTHPVHHWVSISNSPGCPV